MQKVKNKFNNLTPKQREFINFFVPRPSWTPNGYEWIGDGHGGWKMIPIPYATSISSQNIHTIITDTNSMINELRKLKNYAIVLTNCTTITAAIAAADWLTAQWPEAVITTAAAIADGVATGLAWQTYNQTVTPLENCIAEISSIYSGFLVILNDLEALRNDIKIAMSDWDSLKAALIAAKIANCADIIVDPTDARTIFITDCIKAGMDGFGLTSDVLSCVFGSLDVNWTEH